MLKTLKAANLYFNEFLYWIQLKHNFFYVSMVNAVTSFTLAVNRWVKDFSVVWADGWFNVRHAPVTNFYIASVEILWNLWSRGKCLSIRLRKYLPIFVGTFLLKGGLNHIMFLFRCLLVLGLLLSLLLMLLLLLSLLLALLLLFLYSQVWCYFVVKKMSQ